MRKASSPDTRYAPCSAGPGVTRGIPQPFSAGTPTCEDTQKATMRETAVKPVLAVASGTVESPIVLDHESKNSVSEARTESDEGANPGSDA
jgi:hypothetical protein